MLHWFNLQNHHMHIALSNGMKSTERASQFELIKVWPQNKTITYLLYRFYKHAGLVTNTIICTMLYTVSK